MEDQRKLDLIQSWLARTIEAFDNWDYDGKELTIFFKNISIEKYTNNDIREFLKEF